MAFNRFRSFRFCCFLEIWRSFFSSILSTPALILFSTVPHTTSKAFDVARCTLQGVFLHDVFLKNVSLVEVMKVNEMVIKISKTQALLSPTNDD
jgi:hypothetical protein